MQTADQAFNALSPVAQSQLRRRITGEFFTVKGSGHEGDHVVHNVECDTCGYRWPLAIGYGVGPCGHCGGRIYGKG